MSPHALPLVSVVVPTHDRRDFLVDALESVAAQTLKEVEVVLVNDGGPDVADVVASFEGRLAITYVTYAPARERCFARNLALEHARGKYVAYLDDDDVLYPEHLERLASFLDSTGEAVAYSDGVELRYALMPDGTRVVVEREVTHAHPFDRDRFLRENYIPINCVLHRRDCIDRVGGFDVELGIPLEDWDLWLRLSREWDFHRVPGATAEFRTRVDDDYQRRLDRTPFYRNALLLFAKHFELVRGRNDVMQGQIMYLVQIAKELERRAAFAASLPEPAPEPEHHEVRALATVAFADELLAEPGLLAAYGRAFGAADDATLVVYAPDCEEAELVRELGPLAEGIEADLLVLAVPRSADAEERLAATSTAVLTRRAPRGPFAALPHVDADGLAGLRGLLVGAAA